MFALHPRLREDCLTVTDLPLCRLLLMNDASYPWFILVPRREGIREIFELDEADQQQLIRESSRLSKAMAAHFDADKINVAALGNMVSQLHIHHIARFTTDAAWPAPVWGHASPIAYAQQEAEALISRFKDKLIEPA